MGKRAIGRWALVWTLATSAVVAAPRDPAAAELLFREGRKALDAGRTEEACSRFAESQRLDPAAGTLINLAACEEKLGRLASAWQRWQEALRSLRADDERRPGVEQRANSLESRVPRLEIELADGAPAETRVVRDGIELGAASLGLPLPVDPGDHRVEVRAPGRATKTYDVKLAEAEKRALVVEPGAALPVTTHPEPAPVVAPAPRPPPPPQESARVDTASESPTLGWVALGVGAAGIVVGSVTGLVAIQKKNEMEDDCTPAGGGFECGSDGLSAADSGETYATVSTIAFAAGIAGLGIGAYLVLSSSGSAPTTAVGARATRSGAVFGVAGAF